MLHDDNHHSAAQASDLAASSSAGSKRPVTGEEIYRQNLELAETNKTLMLLRKIDSAVLSPEADRSAALQEVATSVAEDSGFPLAAIYLRNRNQVLKPQAVVTRIGDPAAQQQLEQALSSRSISLHQPTGPLATALSEGLIISTLRLFEAVQPTLPIDEAEDLQKRLSLMSFYVCPLQARGRLIGLMVLGAPMLPQVLGFYQKNLIERLTFAVAKALDNALLYEEVREQAATLRQANRHLKELDRAKDEFISLASHELRTPLTNVKGYLSILLQGDVSSKQQQHEFLQRAFEGSQRMAVLIADLMNVSQLVAGKFVVNTQPVDLHQLVCEEVEQLQPRAQAKNLELSYQPPPSPLEPVMIDKEKTRQVVINLLDNAVRYTARGSITVSLAKKAGRIELRVSDTGIGIPAAAKKRVFTKFFRAANARKIRPDGTGVGMFLAKKVTQEQGGDMILESTEGVGSTFGFWLPLSPAPQSADRPNKA